MKRATDWHRISNVDSEALTGDCSRCGPGIPVKRITLRGELTGHACRFTQALAVARHRARARGEAPPDLEPEVIAELSRTQKTCLICGKERPLAIDHHHGTGAFRGLLCHPCNRGIGFLGDSPETLERAAAYIRGELA